MSWQAVSNELWNASFFSLAKQLSGGSWSSPVAIPCRKLALMAVLLAVVL
jgi:hypothetical protein